MADEHSRTERRSAPSRRRRARASDADAEVNPPGDPSQRRAAPGWERRSKEMPGRQGTMKTAPWKENEAPIDASPPEGTDGMPGEEKETRGTTSSAMA